MAIARNPKRSVDPSEQFIADAGRAPAAGRKQPIMLRVAADLILRIDAAARRLGISRSAFMVSSTAEKLERMEAPRNGPR